MGKHRELFITSFAWLYLFPTYLLVAPGGSLELQRLGNSISAAILLLIVVIALFSRREFRAILTYPSTLLACILCAAVISTIASLSTYPAAAVFENMLRLGIFSAFLLAWGMFRAYGLREVAARFILPSAICLTAILLQTVLNPTERFGRHFFLGYHPNLGGEVLVFLVFFLSFSKTAVLRWIFYASSLYLLYLFQSRAALITTLAIIFAAETFLHKRGPRRLLSPKNLLLTSVGVAILGTSFVFLHDRYMAAFAWSAEYVFFLNDANRGLGTGLVGREQTYATFVMHFAESPFFGIGFGNLYWRNEHGVSDGVHNGFLTLIGELGVLGLGVLSLLFYRLIRERHDTFLTLVRISLCVMFFLSARSINIGLFPMLFWIMFLPWPDTRRPDEAVTASESRIPSNA